MIVTKEFISTNQDFINGVTIEKISVDSIGEESYPLKFTSYYTTTCRIQHPQNKAPNPPSKIEFYMTGKYSWDEDTTKTRYVLGGLSRKSLDTTETAW